jgi:decaprenylphospho-beta-D-ribofuranose 2-oxidase
LSARLDAIVLHYGGRIYLAKDALTTSTAIARMYLRLDEFRQTKAKTDPDARFVSAQARRLGIVP